jgi:hypothetical protein
MKRKIFQNEYLQDQMISLNHILFNHYITLKRDFSNFKSFSSLSELFKQLIIKIQLQILYF